MRRDDAIRLARRIGLKVVYWAAVLALSIVILVLLIMLIESRDKSNVGQGGDRNTPAQAANPEQCCWRQGSPGNKGSARVAEIGHQGT